MGTSQWDGVRNHEAKNIMKSKMKLGHRVGTDIFQTGLDRLGFQSLTILVFSSGIGPVLSLKLQSSGNIRAS
jgi:hypothetical protein